MDLSKLSLSTRASGSGRSCHSRLHEPISDKVGKGQKPPASRSFGAGDVAAGDERRVVNPIWEESGARQLAPGKTEGLRSRPRGGCLAFAGTAPSGRDQIHNERSRS
jgi:hypothetical protein